METSTTFSGDVCLGASFTNTDPPPPPDFFCSGDAMHGYELVGQPQVSAHLESEVLRTALDRDSLVVHYGEIGIWIEIEGVGANTEVLISEPYSPLMTLYTDPNSGGRVVYTNFRNEFQASSDLQAILRALIFQL
jgi:hypothetical protein